MYTGPAVPIWRRMLDDEDMQAVVAEQKGERAETRRRAAENLAEKTQLLRDTGEKREAAAAARAAARAKQASNASSEAFQETRTSSTHY